MISCNFCGSSLIKYYYNKKNGWKMPVECEQCGCYGYDMFSDSNEGRLITGNGLRKSIVIFAFLTSTIFTSTTFALIYGKVGFWGVLSVFYLLFLCKVMHLIREK